jgi:hypothetical protein
MATVQFSLLLGLFQDVIHPVLLEAAFCLRGPFENRGALVPRFQWVRSWIFLCLKVLGADNLSLPPDEFALRGSVSR